MVYAYEIISIDYGDEKDTSGVAVMQRNKRLYPANICWLVDH